MSERTVTFWSEVKRRIVVVSTMERDVRLTFITGAAVVALAILLNFFDSKEVLPIQTLVGTIPLPTLLFLAAGEAVVLRLRSALPGSDAIADNAAVAPAH